jgi:DDB1- and CUL4-associated factor 8
VKIEKYLPHKDMVKKLEIEPTDPSIFYSCSQDGTVRFFDIRESVEENSKENHILVHLEKEEVNLRQRTGRYVEINSISLNKQDSNYFIIGGGDPYVRLYDRRRIENVVKKFSPIEKLDQE